MFFYGSNLFHWKSRKQGVVAGSSAEAEYIALYDGMKEGLWIFNLCFEFGLIKEGYSIKSLVDSQSAMAIATKDSYSNKVKHFDLRLNSVKNWIKEMKFILEYCPTEKMIADILTKSLNKNRFELLRNLSCIGRISRRSVEDVALKHVVKLANGVSNNGETVA